MALDKVLPHVLSGINLAFLPEQRIVPGTLGGEFEQIEMEYVYSTGIRGQNGIQIRVFHPYSSEFHVFWWNTWRYLPPLT